MQISTSLVVIVSLALVGQAMAATANDGTLVVHPASKDELSHNDLVNQLSVLRYDVDNRKVPVSVHVADVLYRTKDKDSMVVISNVTVGQLIGANNFRPLTDCSKEAFKKRTAIWDKLPWERRPPGVVFGVKVYILRCLHLAVAYCLNHQDEVVSQKINDAEWMEGLRQANFFEGQSGGPDERRDEDTVASAKQSNVVFFIEN